MKWLDLLISVGSGLTVALAIGASVSVFRWVRFGPAETYAKKYRRHLEKEQRAFVTSEFKRALRASLSSFFCCLLVLVMAVVLSFLEDFLRATHRPAPMVLVAHYGSLLAFVVDMIIFGKLIWDAVMLGVAAKTHEPQGRE